ncbi:MAG TPA: hypothetical protein PKM36_06980 [Propionibacteriaceae bacterium]|nr:hypothetical protein [Propionibacteriaceae bacterium]
MAILSDTVDMVESWSDGDFSFGDITTPIAVGADLLAAVLDPVGALIAAPLGELLDFVVHHCKFISEPLARLEGSDELVQAQVAAWDKVAQQYVDAGNAHAAGVNDLTGWTGPAAEQYREIQKAVNAVFGATADACQKMGTGVQAAGVLVGMVRGFIWDMISQLLASAISAGIAALAAAIPSLGASLAAFASWYTMKIGAVAIKIFNVVQKLLGRAAKFASKCKTLSKAIRKAQNHCKKIIKQLRAAQRMSGRLPTRLPNVPRGQRNDQVPRGALPGDTTVGRRPGTSTPAGRGPIDPPGGIDVGGTARDQVEDAVTNTTVGDVNRATDRPSDRITKIE